MKKDIAFLTLLIIIFSVITAIIIGVTDKDKVDTSKIEIVATLFPQYDFAKQIGGDKVNVTLLLPPGVESHSYEPTPKDIVNINKSKLFIYTGSEMEPWAGKLIDGMKDKVNVLDLSKTINLISEEEFEKEHEHSDDEHIEEEHEHTHSYDPHIWLNPNNAVSMVENICGELCKIDPENEEYYRNNATNYINEIQALDRDIDNSVKSAKTNKIAFGGAFAYAYFIERYELEFISAYDSCGENIEPSTTKIKEVIEYINNNNIPVIFYKEYTNGNIARAISESTGAKMLIFNTVHNVSKQEIENGATYISIMKKNYDNLKVALNIE